jgi:acetyltransferase
MTNITQIAHAVCDVHKRFAGSGKTLSCSFMGAKDVASGIQILQQASIPHYILPEWAADAMTDAVRYRRWLNREDSAVKQYQVDRATAATIIDKAADGYLTEVDALRVLKAYGFPIVDFQLTRTVDEAVAAAERIGYPAVLRVVSPKIVHKFEARGVALNLKSAEEVRTAYTSMREHLLKTISEADLEGILVRKMIPSGKEVILGINRDPVFGHVIMFGLGGIYVEAFKDVTFRVVPIDELTARDMVNGLRASSVLKGLRGEEPSDIAAIEDALKRLSQLAADFPRIAEMDINPLIVHPVEHGAHVADVRIRVQTRE